MREDTSNGTLRDAATIQAERAAVATGGFVRREYPLKGSAANDPAARAIAAELLTASKTTAPRSNQLGASVGPGPQSLTVELRAFVTRHFDSLIDGPGLTELQAVAKEVERERELILYHSSPICQERASQAMRAYAADPSAANLKKVKEEKSFSPQESALVQSCAIQRMDAMLSARLPSIGIPVCEAAMDLVEKHIARLAIEDAARYAEWDLTAVPSALQVELERLLPTLKNELVAYRDGGAPAGGLTGLLRTIIEVAAEPKA